MSWQGEAAVVAARLLEREAELDAIDRAISAGRAGSGGFVVFEGPPGVGKSALLATASEQATSCGMRVLYARACDLERGFAFGVVRQLFESLLLRASPRERDALLAGAGGAGLLVGAPGPPASGAHVAVVHDDAFEALHGLFWLTANIAARAPLLIAIDDLEGCDAGSLRWLAYLGRRLHGMAVLIVAGAHAGAPGADGALLAEAMADALVLRPGLLGPLSTASLVHDALATDPDDDFCATCHAATRGSPLLLHELLEALAAEDIAPVARERGRALSIGAHGARRLVRLRLARLPAQVGALARAVAVLGDGATLDDAAALAGIGEEAAAAATILGQSGLLRLESPLTFAYPLEGAAIYDDIVPLQREAGHAHAARRLSAEHAKAERIADHLLRAPSQHDSFALEVLREAARDALVRGAADAGVGYLRRALREPLRDGPRADVLLELGLAEKLVDLSAAPGHLREALRLLGDDERRGPAGLELAGALFLAGRPEEAVHAFEEALAALEPGRHDLRNCLQAGLLGASLLRPALYPTALREFEAIGAGPPQDGVGAHRLLAMTAHHDARRGNARKACVDRAERALVSGALLEDEDSSAFAYACRVLVVADCFEAAAAAYERSIKRARSRGSLTSLAVALAFRGGLAIHRGALTDAEKDVRAALDVAHAGGVATTLPYSQTYLALTLIEQGDLGAAEVIIEQFAHERDCACEMPFYLLVSGRLRRAQGDASGALAMAIEAAHAYASTGQRNPAFAAWRSEVALARLALGDRDGAREPMAEDVRLARSWGAPRTLGRALRVAGLAEGGERGLILLREASTVLARSPARLERAKTLVELGAAVRRSGRRTEARALLREGLDLADACAARPLADQARGDLRAAGARPRRARLTGIQALTPSEQRITAMAAEGMTNREIARALFVTDKTVEAHLSSVYRKLDISSRRQLPKELEPAVEKRQDAPDDEPASLG